MSNEIMTIEGVDCYEQDDVAYLRLENVARGLGFTTTQTIDGVEYTNIRWNRVDGYLQELGFATSGKRPDFIPENVFYRLAMKAKNETAEKFQALVADEIIPSIRKHGAYMTPMTIDSLVQNPDLIIRLCEQLKDEQARNSRLTVDKAIMQPKADYFDELVDRNLLTSFRDTAKELKVPPKKFVQFLLDRKYIYRDKKGKLLPYQSKNDGLFEVKECFNEKTNWSGSQTMVTPKGRETFRLLYAEV